MVINEALEIRSLSLGVSGASLTGQGNVWILSGPSLEGPEVTLNGVGNGYVAGGPLPEALTPYSLELDTSGAATLDVPASSVTSIVLY